MTIAAFLAAICKFYENKRIIDEEIVNWEKECKKDEGKSKDELVEKLAEIRREIIEKELKLRELERISNISYILGFAWYSAISRGGFCRFRRPSKND
jgi:hypothetical protein